MEDRLDTVVPAPNLITCVERLLVVACASCGAKQREAYIRLSIVPPV